jgi:hypothetical protein
MCREVGVLLGRVREHRLSHFSGLFKSALEMKSLRRDLVTICGVQRHLLRAICSLLVHRGEPVNEMVKVTNVFFSIMFLPDRYSAKLGCRSDSLASS